jgi:hypothetical protein
MAKRGWKTGRRKHVKELRCRAETVYRIYASDKAIPSETGIEAEMCQIRVFLMMPRQKNGLENLACSRGTLTNMSIECNGDARPNFS